MLVDLYRSHDPNLHINPPPLWVSIRFLLHHHHHRYLRSHLLVLPCTLPSIPFLDPTLHTQLISFFYPSFHTILSLSPFSCPSVSLLSPALSCSSSFPSLRTIPATFSHLSSSDLSLRVYSLLLHVSPPLSNTSHRFHLFFSGIFIFSLLSFFESFIFSLYQPLYVRSPQLSFSLLLQPLLSLNFFRYVFFFFELLLHFLFPFLFELHHRPQLLLVLFSLLSSSSPHFHLFHILHFLL
uniref:Uncharacterized protein n=1 Tax=Cacopsylla melanoneura TaxID=428564 RepID=A0A8D8XF97_9HEMI